MESLKAVGAFCFGLVFIVGMGCLVVALFAGVAQVSLEIFFYLGWIWQTALLVAIFILLPLALFRSTRKFAAVGFYVTSFVFGACTWIFGLIVTWNYWGLIVAFIGIAFFGVGVVPLAMVASAFHSDWTSVLAAIIGLGLTFITRAVAVWLANKVDRYNIEQKMKIVDGYARSESKQKANQPSNLLPVRSAQSTTNAVAGAPTSTPPATKAAAPQASTKSAQRYGFGVKDFIVYPAHGVGQILTIEEQEIAGAKLELFVINFMKDKMTLRVPTKKLANVGIRKLSDPATIQEVYQTLGRPRHVAVGNWSRLAQEYEAKINSGDIIAIAEVVRDLYRPAVDPGQSYSERQLYEAALDRLSREVAIVQLITEEEAVKELESLVIARFARRI